MRNQKGKLGAKSKTDIRKYEEQVKMGRKARERAKEREGR